ncbi:hypothetical protein BZG35_07820 [Brevundimonas sp. LM2]|uniref:hypothetical protein n=1 Tax=Brevundimonas sp. LM2 TaxID=1938605 RepID=UPI000983E3D2|nr:hypothetical protein [Brevundimonas sp. LM2]AQR61569.1 hypothetical protein BZG35_07820 [Brevundimonas sp. LM2]
MTLTSHAALAMAAAFALSACGEAVAPAPAPAPASAAAPATPPVDAAVPAPASAEGGLAIEGEGLRLFTASGSARPIPFGAPQADVLAAVTRAVGGAAPAVTTNGECGAGPVQFAPFANGLNLAFQDGRFAGWFLDKPGPTTVDGVGVGTPRAALDDARTIEIVPDSTLGVEFRSGDLGGFLTAAGADGTVESLYAGLTCFFR